MLQNLIALTVSLLLCVALLGCGREQPQTTPTTPEDGGADVPILVPEQPE